MYVILVYDFGEKRVNKMLKLCRRYLNWIQNSVFEGEISEVRLKDEDSVIVFSGPSQVSLEKRIIGKERSSIDNFL